MDGSDLYADLWRRCPENSEVIDRVCTARWYKAAVSKPEVRWLISRPNN